MSETYERITVGDIVWRHVEPAPMHGQEPVRCAKDGSDILQLVDLTDKPWRMSCACGRVRYARANSLHQISACWVCTREARAARRRKQSA